MHHVPGFLCGKIPQVNNIDFLSCFDKGSIFILMSVSGENLLGICLMPVVYDVKE